jgi:hypothetical protein
MSVSDLLKGWADTEAALPDYLEAEKYANGEVDEIFASATIRDKLAETGDGYRFNLIRTAITARLDRCEIDMIKVPDNEAATDVVTEIWDANEMAIHYPGLLTKTFTYGDAYVQMWEIDEEMDTVGLDPDLIACKVEITVHDPKNARMIYDPQNHRRKLFMFRRWCEKTAGQKETWRVDLYYADVVERWISTSSGALTEESGWAPFEGDEDDDQGAVLVHTFGEVPFFHHRTDLPYGVPVHKQGYGSQNAINKELITLLTTTDSQGHGQRYQLLKDDAVLDENNDDPQWVEDGDASAVSPGGMTKNGGIGSGQRTGPGTMQTFTGTEEVGTFPAADPAVFTDPVLMFIRLLAQTTNTPLHDFDPSGDVPSGESLKREEAPLVKSIEWLQVLQASPLKEQWRFALRIRGVSVPRVEVRWAPVTSADSVDDWTVVAAKQAAGVPVDQTLMEAGYVPEQVADWLDASAEAATLAQRVALLGQIGTAVRDISSGVALGVLSEQSAGAAVELVLNQVNASGTGADPS